MIFAIITFIFFNANTTCLSSLADFRQAFGYSVHSLDYTGNHVVVILNPNLNNIYRYDNVKYVSIENLEYVLKNIRQDGNPRAYVYDPSGRFSKNAQELKSVDDKIKYPAKKPDRKEKFDNITFSIKYYKEIFNKISKLPKKRINILVFSDIDGTIINHSNKTNNNDISLLNELIEDPYKFVLRLRNSRTNTTSIEPQLIHLTKILSSPQLNTLKNIGITFTLTTARNLKTAMQDIVKYKLPVNILSTLLGTEINYIDWHKKQILRSKEWTDNLGKYNWDPFKIKNTILASFQYIDGQISLQGPQRQNYFKLSFDILQGTRQISELKKNLIKKYDVEFKYSPNFIDVTPAAINKETAMLFLKDQIPHDKIVIFGDSRNDIELLSSKQNGLDKVLVKSPDNTDNLYKIQNIEKSKYEAPYAVINKLLQTVLSYIKSPY